MNAGVAHKLCLVEEGGHRDDDHHNDGRDFLDSFDTSSTSKRRNNPWVIEPIICTTVNFATVLAEKLLVSKCCNKDNKTCVVHDFHSANDRGQLGLRAKLFHPCEHR